MDKNKYTEDDYCDIYENKLCDNCGKCLENDGVDVKAINIEDIAKTVEENEFLIQEALKANESELTEIEELEEYEDSVLEENTEYIDAFDHIEYLEDFDANDDGDISDLTEEVFPGVRRLKKRD